MTALQKLDKELMAECKKQILCVYGAAGIALGTQWGWGTRKIDALYELTWEIWNECGEYGTDKSMLEMLEEETSIEMRLTENGRSYHEIDYLNGKLHMYKIEKMNMAQCIMMRRGQIKWTTAIIQACLYLALHRKYGFGAQRIQRLVNQIFEIWAEENNDPKKIAERCREVTKINIIFKFLDEKRLAG